MKPLLPTAILLLFASISFQSCSVNKDAVVKRQAEIRNSKEPATGCFVKLNDGSIQAYKTLVLVTGIFTSPHLLADDTVKIFPGKIIAYQNAEHFAVAQKTFTTAKLTHAAVETLPGFAVRIAKGNLNVYCKKYYNGHRAVDEFFVQKGDDGEIVAYNTQTSKDVIKKYPEVASIFDGVKFIGNAVSKQQSLAQSTNGSLTLTKK